MNIIIDPKIIEGNVYWVKIKLTQLLKPRGKIENYYETSFNPKQKDVGINRAIKINNMEKDKITTAEVTMLRDCGLSSF